MKPLFFSLCLASLGGFFTVIDASAAGPGGFAGPAATGYPFVPFGFYQPYGAHYGTSLRTPPYFALNPPVYYGTRYARPYGVSPFAAPPMVDAPASYRAQVSPAFVRPPVGNPYISNACTSGCAEAAATKQTKVVVAKPSEIRLNPFVSDSSRIAQR